ncbi:hypothetical protein CAQUA_09635 [Corynebacterium aquatimens]|nr:hypothetical protein CAQUA_09635 [Corynebacterium aquatimens]
MSVPMHVDPDEMRSLLRSEIDRYTTAIETMNAQRPALRPGDCGEGFVSHGEQLAAAVDMVHDQTIKRLQQRIRQCEEIAKLIDDVSLADDVNADQVSQVSRHG